MTHLTVGKHRPSVAFRGKAWLSDECTLSSLVPYILLGYDYT
jgi:hypothetical protein